MLGPRPVIASLSLGATRTFRLRSMAAQDMQSHAAKQQQEHSLAASPSQSQHLRCTASHESALGSGAQPNNQVNEGSQQVQQQQDKRISNAAQAIGYGTSAQPAMQPGGVCAIAQHSRVTTAQQSHEAGCVSSIDVVLPHNTLVIMWPPMQEAWKHEVILSERVLNAVQPVILYCVPLSPASTVSGQQEQDGLAACMRASPLDCHLYIADRVWQALYVH